MGTIKVTEADEPGTALVTDLAADVRVALRDAADFQRAVNERRYLRSELEHYGASVPVTRRVVAGALRRLPQRRDVTLALAKALWQEAVHELRMAAAIVLARRQALLELRDLDLLERLLRESRTWALTDTLAPHALGGLLERYPHEVHAELVRWSQGADFWLRRSAVLAYLLPMREGKPVFEAFAALAEPLLPDKEFFVRKALGWVLRERTKRSPEEVFAWLLPRRDVAAKLTLREAGKNLGERRLAELLA